MKKFLSLITCLALSAGFLVTPAQAASGINAEEQKILDTLNAGVMVNGKKVTLDTGYVNSAQNYFMTDGVDVTSAQAAVVLAQLENAKKVMVDNGITDLYNMRRDLQDQIIGYAQVAAKELGLTLVVDYAAKTITVKDAKGNILVTVSKVIKNTGDDFTSTLAISSTIALLLAGAGVVAFKKGLFARG